jgi:peptidoglycan/xylan/chitin deacetylase (PgdA/CDA1 family)
MVGVSLSFDVDAEAGLACRPGSFEGRLSSLSEARFAIVRGIGRVLELLTEYRVAATFYVPGVVAERDAAAVREIASAGHEVAHHGHRHLPAHALDEAGQGEEIERGLAALQDCLGTRVTGYRSPAWELTPITLALLGEHGFAFDSSLMGDDRPYRIHAAGRTLAELPVHWSLDDVPYLAYAPEIGGHLGHPNALLATWVAEHDAAAREGRHLTYTMHPEIIGRAHRLALLRGLLDHLRAHRTPTYTHGDAARDLLAAAA